MSRMQGKVQQTEFYRKIVAVVCSIPPGRVASYGQVAALAGFPGYARHVSRVLRAAPDGDEVPWHRVLSAEGRIRIPHAAGAQVQRQLLLQEGVVVDGRRVDLKRFGWDPFAGK